MSLLEHAVFPFVKELSPVHIRQIPFAGELLACYRCRDMFHAIILQYIIHPLLLLVTSLGKPQKMADRPRKTRFCGLADGICRSTNTNSEC